MTTPRGVNAELTPLVRMTFPEGSLDDLGAAPRGEPVFVSWLLLFGLIPFDRHVFILQEAGERHFVETSRSALQKLWRHERYVEPTPDGCTVRDVVTPVPRLAFAAPLTRAIAAAIFRHRHRRLKQLYG
ncbi:MAG TPA: hypothetical protein VD906_04970 [Caulobacteraceae bacterium]|nr:hypothetical protein [Caulobacteraceae bacterium]